VIQRFSLKWQTNFPEQFSVFRLFWPFFGEFTKLLEKIDLLLNFFNKAEIDQYVKMSIVDYFFILLHSYSSQYGGSIYLITREPKERIGIQMGE
jgi:hypothetical protein